MTVRETGKEISICGTAEPNESLSLRIGPVTTTTVRADENGTWEQKIASVAEISGFETNSRIEFDVFARYSANNSIQSDHILLISDVQTGKTDHTPLISTSNPITATEGDDILLEGTADAGAVLTVKIIRGNQNQNLAADKTVTVEEDGSWKLKLNTADIADEREEGSSTRYTAQVFFSFEQKEYQSNSITIIINKPKTYSVPTIAFTGVDGTELSLRYTESVKLSGTARGSEHLRLIINDQEQAGDIISGADGIWNYQINSLETWKPDTGETTELVIRIHYTAVETTPAEPVTLFVTNPLLDMLTVSLSTDQDGNGSDAEQTIGLQGTAMLTVTGSAGQDVELLRNNILWKTLKLDETGTTSVQMTSEDIPSGTNQVELRFRYVQQNENRL